MVKNPKAKKEKAEGGAAETKVVYLNLPFSIADDLAKEADENMRPISVQAAWIIKQYFESRKKSK
jgi:hypothetical protein